MNLVHRKINNIDVFYLPTDKFKTISCSVVFYNNFLRSEFNERNMLADILVENMKKFPNNEIRNEYLNNLYSLEAFGICTQIGESIINHFVVSYPNEKYLVDEKNLTEKAFEFLNEVITNPKMSGGQIIKKAINEKLDEAQQMYFTLRQQKSMFAQYEFLKAFFQDYPDRFRIYPDFNLLDTVSSKTMTKVYDKMLKKDNLKIFVIGDFEYWKMDRVIEENFKFAINKKSQIITDFNPVVMKIRKPKEVVEYDDVSQSRIFMGYQTDVAYYSDLHPAFSVFEAMFGGYDQSQLFLKIREEMHLSYYVHSAHYAEEQMLVVAMGTNKKDEQKAIDKVKEILTQIQNGEFTDENFNLAKNYCINALEKYVDSQTAHLVLHIKSILRFNRPYDYQKRIKKYENVTREEVIKAANSLKLKTVFRYTNGENKDEN